MKLIYLHGFNSSNKGSTARELSRLFPELIAVTYDYCNPNKAFEQINSLITNELKDEKEIVLIGSSLGGFWANHFAQLFNLKCLLINPSLIPSRSLTKYIGSNTNYSTNQIKTLTIENCNSYSKYETNINENTFRTVIISMNDTIVNYYETIELLEGSKFIFHPLEGHQFKDYQFLEKEINTLINTIAI